MAETRTKNSLINVAAGIIVKLVAMVLAFVVRTIFIKTLGMQYAGLSGVFTDILTLLSFAELGIGTAVVFSLYKPIALNDKNRIAVLIKFYKTVYRIITLVIIVLGISLIPFLSHIIKDVPDVREDITLIYFLYILSTASSYLFIYKTTFLTAAQKDYVVSRYRLIISITKTAVECVLLMVFRNFIIYLVFNILVVIFQNYIISLKADKLYPEINEKTADSLPREDRRGLFRDVYALMLYKVAGVVQNGTNSIVISAFISTVWVGIVGNYNLIISQLNSLITQIFTATSASIGNLAAVETDGAQYAVFKKLNFICFWIHCFCSACLWTLINPFMLLWQGSERTLSAFIVFVMVFEFYTRGMAVPVNSFRNSNGLFVQGKYRPLIMAVINIVVSVLLVQVIGIAGVILGTIISRVLTQLWYDPYLVYRKVFKRSSAAYFKQYAVYGLVTAASCISTQALARLISLDNQYLAFTLEMCVCAAFPNIIIILLFHRTQEFKEILLLLKNIIRIKKR